uniref:NADH-ubiquinone oxidoreductase chain 5 n=1 Tax=Malaxella flava TaxID=871443 RepID=A0A7S5DCQ2_9HEMI|nr:NADH dehydrogenase subunit 5 [Malaxella flava]
MMFVYNIFFFFLFFFIFFFFFGLYMYLFNFSIVLDYNFFNLNSSLYSFIFFFDWLSLIFLSIVFLISGSVMLYSLDYMSGDIFIIRFYFLVFMFITSMFMLISMPDLICLMIGWDGLGLVSYCLVIYYQNSLSLSSGYLTLFINRLGDLFLIFCIAWCFNYGCWHYIFIYSFYNLNYWLLIFLILACLTKSAQFPFSSWLPAAMAAPTPVSSLVHSSTLVTAGVYLIIRFNMFLDCYIHFFLMNISLLTILLSGFGAIYENDLKKIVAFSTMGQLGLMIFIINMGCEYLGFIHMLIHAVFKSLLFLCSGFFIYGYLGVQDIRFMGNISIQSPLIGSCFLISLFSLCGLPFYSGFFSKDFIIELVILSQVNFFYFLTFFFSIYLTLVYCIRLFMYLFVFNLTLVIFNLSMKKFMNISCFILTLFSIGFGSLIFWMLDSMYVFVFDFYYKYLVIFFFMYFLTFFNLFSFLSFNFDKFLVYFFGYMWFLPFFSSSFLVSKFFNLSHYLFTIFELGWTEYIMTLNLIKFFKFKSLYLNLSLLNSFSVYFFSFFFFLLVLFFI